MMIILVLCLKEEEEGPHEEKERWMTTPGDVGG